ncbi:hypothetical protein CQA53_08745 [Helicobacter didelphidarum]|uniref:Uncharacterized protein n=1 Tax=Helicobacter didelphidarum TaxID=2040648 RepID=A0A3D8IEY6_9HELI|nr:hypothetical protein [Helicobacter didelphidarum]RDU63101.1 hypothetical protein CQA53_08745 [Helicobacter didelphidarum]
MGFKSLQDTLGSLSAVVSYDTNKTKLSKNDNKLEVLQDKDMPKDKGKSITPHKKQRVRKSLKAQNCFYIYFTFYEIIFYMMFL